MTDHRAMVNIHLIGVPIDIWRRASAHQEAIQREFDILRTSLPTGSVPHQLIELLADLDLRFAGFRDPAWQKLYDAEEQGDSEIDLVLTVPAEIAEASRRLGVMLDSVDEFCRTGDEFLTLATPPDLVAFRKWFLGEFLRQGDDGSRPLAWGEFDADEPQPEIPEQVTASGSNSKSTPIRFRGDLDLATAGALRNQILSARAGGSMDLVLDLSEVDFMDSVGLSVVVSTFTRLAEEGGQLSLILPDRLRRLFEISGLIDLLRPRFVRGSQPEFAE